MYSCSSITASNRLTSKQKFFQVNVSIYSYLTVKSTANTRTSHRIFSNREQVLVTQDITRGVLHKPKPNKNIKVM